MEYEGGKKNLLLYNTPSALSSHWLLSAKVIGLYETVDAIISVPLEGPVGHSWYNTDRKDHRIRESNVQIGNHDTEVLRVGVQHGSE